MAVQKRPTNDVFSRSEEQRADGLMQADNQSRIETAGFPNEDD